MINSKQCKYFFTVIILSLVLTTPIFASDHHRKNFHVCFTPGGHCTQMIVSTIVHAKKSIAIQAYSFTSKPIAKALLNAKQRGVNVVAIVDKSNVHTKYSKIQMLLTARIPVYIDYKVHIAHNKVIIVDSEKVLTGSFNFSWSAQHRNAENVLLVNNLPLAKQYTRNFNRRLHTSIPYSAYCFVGAKHHCRVPVVKSWDGILPPHYLSVPHWQHCFATEQRGTWQSYCLPTHRPTDCPLASWQQLKKETAVMHCKH